MVTVFELVDGDLIKKQSVRATAVSQISSCLMPLALPALKKRQLSDVCSSETEDPQHILTTCSALHSTRNKLLKFTSEYCHNRPKIRALVHEYCHPSHPQFCQFIIDCSILPPVIPSVQQYGSEVLADLFHITRTWCYLLHKNRMKVLGIRNTF